MSLTKVSFSMIQGAPTNVMDYGAKGDGIADDYAAIQAAWDATGNIYFPPGTYLVKTSLNFTNAVGGKIKGSGRYGNGSSYIKGTADIGNYPIMDFSGSNGIELENFYLGTNNTDECFIGILFARVGGASSGTHSIRNINVYGKFAHSCIYKSSSEENTFFDVWSETLSAGARSVSDVDVPESNVLSLYQDITSPYGGNTGTRYISGRYINQTSNAANRAFYIKNSRNLSLNGVYLNAGDAATYAIQSVNNITTSFKDCTCENTCLYVIGVTGTSTQDLTIDTCTFNSATGATLFGDVGTELIKVAIRNTYSSVYVLYCDIIKNSEIDCYGHFAQVNTSSWGNNYLNVADSNAIALASSFGDSINIGTVGITANVGKVFNLYETQISMPTATYNNIDRKKASFLQAYGTTGTITITGFTAGYEGQELIFLHPPVDIVYKNQNVGSSIGNRIITKTNADLTVPANTSNAERFIYSQGVWFQI